MLQEESNGATVLPMKPKMKLVKIGAKVPAEVEAALRKKANDAGISKAAIIRWALASYVGQPVSF